MFSFPILEGHNLTRALQFSPFQNPGGGGYPERDGVRTDKRADGRKKSLCLILDNYIYKYIVFIKPARSAGARRAPALRARALAKFTPVHHWEAECDEYLFLTEYEYRIFSVFRNHRIPNIEYYSVLRKSEYRIPYTIRYQENPNTEYEQYYSV